ncbi:MAG: type II toxin-antitoxin system HicB family antitoxin [Novosphingobium sp.]
MELIESRRFSVTIAPLSPEDGGGFVATAPDLPGCISDGATPAEALANVYDAISCWIEAAVAMGRPVPEPRAGLLTA